MKLREGHDFLDQPTKNVLLWEEDAGLAELNKARGIVSLLLPLPRVNLFRTQGALTVSTGFVGALCDGREQLVRYRQMSNGRSRYP